jgi:glycosyltransferase involved in cell wall biosynthesis
LKDLAAKEQQHLVNTWQIPDLVCLSHLRWNFVFQRPQHLMTRFATQRRVFFFEEPLFDVDAPELIVKRDRGVYVCVPHLPHGLSHYGILAELRRLLSDLLSGQDVEHPIFWYYTPMALEFTRDLSTGVVVFDCMDELSAFAGAPPELIALETELLSRADLVFTGGESLFEAKRNRGRRVHAFPSSVDVAHFSKARSAQPEPADQAGIPHPRLGFFGVIDERMDTSLLADVAVMRPGWHLVILGPCVKIDAALLPAHPNIHYLGMKTYDELPAYLAGWDVALLPFARNGSTQFISPTKTPEYLAAGCPVVSTSVRDVIRPYGEQNLVAIADTAAQFVEAIEAALTALPTDWRNRVDRFLSTKSWDRTWAEMSRMVDEVANQHIERRDAAAIPSLSRPSASVLRPPRPSV